MLRIPWTARQINLSLINEFNVKTRLTIVQYAPGALSKSHGLTMTLWEGRLLDRYKE